MKFSLVIPVLFFAFTQTASASFTDVPNSHPYAEAINWAQQEGIVDGYSNGAFKPDNTINRAEFVKIISGYVSPNGYGHYTMSCFTDVQEGQWFEPYVCSIKDFGYIGGYADGTFKPANSINYVEAAKIIVGVDSEKKIKAQKGEDWYIPYTRYVDSKNAKPSTVNSNAKNITRGEMVYMMYQLSSKEVPEASVEVQSTTATMKTSYGDIQLELYSDTAPKTVENFVTHAQNGYYDGLTFHRVIPGFMIQGGDPKGDGTGGESIWGKDFEDEFAGNHTMDYGTLAMANAGPNTNGSQFFIVQAKNGTPWLEGKHTIFGKVTSGMEVVDAIANAERGANDKPLEDITFSISTQ